MKHKLTPAYAKIKIKTNKAAPKTKEQSQTLRIKNELKCLQIKKSEINNNLYYLQNDGVKIYGKNWPIIENQIHEQIKHIINYKYNTINAKIERMKKTRTKVNQDRQHDNKQDNKITNLTNVILTRNELEVLNLGYKYNFHSTNSTHIKYTR